MTSREIKNGNHHAWARGSAGYLRRCRACGEVIYMKRDNDGAWRPYESWVAGNVSENQWRLHDCRPLTMAA